MLLRSVRIQNFRNLQNVTIDLSEGHAAFVGPNGAGKTNLIEAVYFALKGRPFRSFVQRTDLFSNDLQKTLISAPLQVDVFLQQEGARNSEVLVSGNAETKRFQIKINDKKVPVGQLISRFPVVAFSPQDHELVRGGPEGRRDFLDQVFADICPGYFEMLEKFNRSLKQRNTLLRAIRDERATISELQSWNDVFIEAAIDLQSLRREAWPEFFDNFIQLRDSMELSFGSDLNLNWLTHTQSKDSLQKLLKEDQAKDLSTGWTHKGPHRDDLEILLSEQKVKGMASQGQGRLIGLLLRWTHARWIQKLRQEKALFLLDDFSSELDAHHRDQLIQNLLENSHQLLWTSTELIESSLQEIWGKSLKILTVSDGKITAEKELKCLLQRDESRQPNLAH